MSKKKGGDVGKEKILELEKELGGCKDTNLRLRADFENYRKHLDREREEFTAVANDSLIRDLLPTLDDLERARDDSEGIELVYRNLLKILESMGLSRIGCLGKRFDPHYHEVLVHENSDKEDGTVLEELQPGYMLKDKVLRHSMVKIAKNP